MKAIRHLATALLITTVAVTASYALSKGDKAPDFRLKTIDGKTVSLSTLRTGKKAILLDFWATNCPPCVEEIPHLQKYYEQFGKQGLVIVGISGYRGDSIADVKSFVKQKKLTYPIPYDADKKVATQYALRYLPTMYLIDKNGVIRNVHIGYTEPEVLKSEIRALLK